MSIKKVSVVTLNGKPAITTSRPKAVRAVIMVRQHMHRHNLCGILNTGVQSSSCEPQNFNSHSMR